MPSMLRNKGPREGACQRVFLATPAYDGLSAGYVSSIFGAQRALADAGIESELAVFAENCHVDDARNQLVRDFLDSDCTDLIFLDADLRWSNADLVKLAQYDRDVVAATYPLKQDEDGYPVRFIGDEIWADEDGLIEVESVPTGFLRINRFVLVELAEKAQKFRGKQDKPNQSPIPLIFERLLEDGKRWGGDYTFCRKWRAMGGTIWLDPEPKFGHTGSKEWSGSLARYLIRKNGLEGHRIAQLLNAIQDGSETPDTYTELVELWGNEWSAKPEMLAALVELARDADGDVIECGSGLTTLILAVLGEKHGFKVVSLEHDRDFAAATTNRLRDFGLEAEVKWAPIKDFGGYQWYDASLSGEYALAVCDGPPRASVGRYGAVPALRDSLSDGALIIADDAETEHDILDRWSEEFGITFHVMGEQKPYAIGRL